MMKRAIIRGAAFLMLALSLLTVQACGGTPSELDPFRRAMGELSCSRAHITTSIDSPLGDVSAEYEVTYSDGSAEVSYVRNSLSGITPDKEPDDLNTTERDTITVTPDSTGKLGGLVANVLFGKIMLNEELIEYTVNGDVLDFTVKADAAEEILGATIGYDARVKITLREGKLAKIEINYATIGGEATLTADFE